MSLGRSAFLADCHLHFEGCLPKEFLKRLARRAGHPFSDWAAFERRRRKVTDSSSFLSLYAEVCRLFRRPEDYAEAASAIVDSLAADGVCHAEIFVSPEIFSRVGLDPAACLIAIDDAFRSGRDRIRCQILLDAVRQWGPESAERVLDLYERTTVPSVAGFGIGGDENSVPAASFAGVYARARALGLKTTVHAGEWGGADSLREALDALRPDRVDHGIAAVDDPELLRRLADEGTVLCVAPSGNVVTGAAEGFGTHPLPRLLSAGVRAALSADDPLFFGTTTLAEYRIARERFGFADSILRRLAETSWRGAFCQSEEREKGLEALHLHFEIALGPGPAEGRWESGDGKRAT